MGLYSRVLADFLASYGDSLWRVRYLRSAQALQGGRFRLRVVVHHPEPVVTCLVAPFGSGCRAPRPPQFLGGGKRCGGGFSQKTLFRGAAGVCLGPPFNKKEK